MKYQIRPFDYSDLDYEGVLETYNAVWPDHGDTVFDWKFDDERRNPKFFYSRFVAELTGTPGTPGRVVAHASCGESFWSYVPGKYFVAVNVHPDFRHHGIGSALYDTLMRQLLPRQPEQFTCWSREDQPEGIRFLEQHGFAQRMRFPISALDLTTFDPGRFQHRIQQVLASGIEIKDLRELMDSDPAWKDKIYNAINTMAQDVPFADPLTLETQEEWENGSLKHPNFMPEAWRVALDQGEYVGLTMLWRHSSDEHKLNTGLTGVLRSHRRQGIAIALKTLSLQYAQELGYQTVDTDNEEHNPMFQINLQLGFRPRPAGLEFHRECSAADEELVVSDQVPVGLPF